MKYRNVVFLQGDHANQYLKMAMGDAFKHLLQWEYGEGEIQSEPPWGSQDGLARFEDGPNEYVISCNYLLDYIALTAIESGDE